MKHFSGGGAWNLIPFVGGVKAQDEADEYVAKQQGKKQEAIEKQAEAESLLAEALANKESAILKEEKRKAEQSSQLILESGVRKYEKDTRARLFGYDYETTLDALGNEEVQLAQSEVETLTAAIEDESRDNIPQVQFPFKLALGLGAVSAAIFFYQRGKQ